MALHDNIQAGVDLLHKTCLTRLDMDNEPIVFDDGESVLKAELPSERQRLYREASLKFRYCLREKGKSPVAETFKEHLDWKRSCLPPERFEVRREALRWYYSEGRKRMRIEKARHGQSATGQIESSQTGVGMQSPYETL